MPLFSPATLLLLGFIVSAAAGVQRQGSAGPSMKL
jgi:hypothetical protein